MKNAINIGTRREFFWDDFIVDTKLTTARFTACEAVIDSKEPIMELNRSYEQGISYPSILKDENGYKMYYIGYHMGAIGSSGYSEKGGVRVTLDMLESKDGMSWTRPNLGFVEYEGNTDNNIVFIDAWDNLTIQYDPNPDCPPEERYKGIGWGERRNYTKGEPVNLWCYTSPDGYHFTRSHIIHTGADYDSMNTWFWDGEKYVVYMRGYHWDENCEKSMKLAPQFDKIMPNPKTGVRDIRVMYSKDFRNWTEAKFLKYDDDLDLPLYTNNIMKYPRADEMFVGFPTRYCERTAWTANYDRLPNPENRKYIIKRHEPRSGLAVTDCIFMSSRDGETWHRTNRAFLTPGYEATDNWVYGDCYASYPLIDIGDENYYFYTINNHLSYHKSSPLNRYRIRKDGFACREAYGNEEVLVTKPLIFEGGKLFINFETSAMGHIFVEVLDADGNPLSGRSMEMFGNNIDAPVCFEDGGDFSAYAGKEVRLRFTMLDAKIYAFKFEGEA